jgi:hypothetical protein
MYGVFDNSGIHSLNGQQFKTRWTDTITSPPKFGPLGQKQLLIFLPPGGYPIAVKYNISYIYIAQILFDIFLFFFLFFEDRNFEVNSDKILVDLLTFKCKE